MIKSHLVYLFSSSRHILNVFASHHESARYNYDISSTLLKLLRTQAKFQLFFEEDITQLYYPTKLSKIIIIMQHTVLSLFALVVLLLALDTATFSQSGSKSIKKAFGGGNLFRISFSREIIK